MKFIELHRESDGKARMINLDDIAEIRPSADTDSGRAVVEFRGTDIMPMTVKESYTQIHGMLAVAKALVWG